MKTLLNCLLLFVSAGACSQCPEELIVNGGFEFYNECPGNISGAYTDLEFYLGNWVSASEQTPDFFHTCGGFTPPFGGALPTSNVWGGQEPHSGNGMVGFGIDCGTSAGEYIQAELSNPIEPYSDYQLEFWLSSGDSRYIHQSGVACRIIGVEVLFSEAPVFWPNITFMDGYIPQYSTGNEILADSLRWMHFIDTISVNVQAQYVTIGRWSETIMDEDCECFFSGIKAGLTYYYIDDISLKKVEPVIIPNVFTPNRDGMNDFFQIRGYCGDLDIYNRWGQLLTTVSNETGWNGKISGNDAPTDVYYVITEDQKHKRAFQLLR